MKGLGDQILARPALAEKQHRDVTVRHLCRSATDLHHRRIACDQSRQGRGSRGLVDLPQFFLELLKMLGTGDDDLEEVGFYRLVAVVVGAQTDGVERMGPILVPCHDDDLDPGPSGPDRFEGR